MKKIVLLYIALLCLLQYSCKKREYAPDNIQQGGGDIFCDASLGTDQISLRVGTGDYYCYSSFEQRKDSIYLFKAELKKFDCSPCNESLSIVLSDYKKRAPGASVEIDAAMAKGDRGFLPVLANAARVKFSAQSNRQIASQDWTSSTGQSSAAQDAILEFAQPDVQTVSLHVKTTGNCVSVITSNIYIGGSSGLLACNIKPGQAIGKTGSFVSEIIGGKAPYNYLWEFGDKTYAYDESVSHTYTYAGSYPVKLVVVDAENKRCEANCIYVAGNDLSSCAVTMSQTFIGNSNTFFNGVALQWIDKTGKIFRSDKLNQPTESYFTVLDSQPYEANERGESGRLLKVKFNVLLSDGQNQQWFKSENTTIAVSYK